MVLRFLPKGTRATVALYTASRETVTLAFVLLSRNAGSVVKGRKSIALARWIWPKATQHDCPHIKVSIAPRPRRRSLAGAIEGA